MYKQIDKECYKCSYKKGLKEKVVKQKGIDVTIFLCKECMKKFNTLSIDEVKEWMTIINKVTFSGKPAIRFFTDEADSLDEMLKFFFGGFEYE